MPLNISGNRRALAEHLVTDLWTYATEAGGFTLYEDPHREMCDFLESFLPPIPSMMMRAKQRKGMLHYPRETLKTTLAQLFIEYFILKWKLLYNYDARVAIIRSNREAASQVVKAIEEDLGHNNPVLQEAFGSLGPENSLVWAANEMTLSCRDTNYREPTVAAYGTESPMSGFHFDLIVPDDLINETNYESERDCMRARRKLQSLEPIGNKWARILNIGTRWNTIDTAAFILDINGRLAEQGKPPEWDVLLRGAYFTEDEGKHKAGDLVYPAFLSEEALEQKRRGLEPKIFTAWYLNQVIVDESRVFRPEYLRFYDANSEYEPDDEEIASLKIVGGALDGSKFPVRCTFHCDPAATVGAGSNFTGMAIVLTDAKAEESYFVHESWKVKEPPSRIIARIVADARKYCPQSISIDVLGQQVLWLDPLNDALEKAGVRTQVISYKGRTHDEKVGKGILGKAKRIEALEPLFRNGRIYVRRENNSALLHEYNFYDGPTHHNHYDLLDALAHLRTMTRKPNAAKYRDDLEQIEEELELADASGEPERRMVPGNFAGGARRKEGDRGTLWRRKAV